MRSAHLARSSMLALATFPPGCREVAVEGLIPEPAETTAVAVALHDTDGGKIVGRGTIQDRRTIREIHECLTPYEASDDARVMLKLPIAGKLEIQGPRGKVPVEFACAGVNPLNFRVDGKTAPIRGGSGYPGYRADHAKLYGVDAEWIDEGWCLYLKLEALCKQQSRGR